MERHVPEPFPGDLQELGIEVETLHVEALPQVLEVLAGPAGDVEERPRARPPLLDQRRKPI